MNPTEAIIALAVHTSRLEYKVARLEGKPYEESRYLAHETALHVLTSMSDPESEEARAKNVQRLLQKVDKLISLN